jgi:hypothetical protein
VADWVPVLVAIVGGGGPIVALIMRLDRKNDSQHGENARTLSRIEGKVDKLDDRLYDHIQNHDG